MRKDRYLNSRVRAGVVAERTVELWECSAASVVCKWTDPKNPVPYVLSAKPLNRSEPYDEVGGSPSSV